MIKDANKIDPQRIDSKLRTAIINNANLFPTNRKGNQLSWKWIEAMGRSEVIRILEHASRIDKSFYHNI